MEEVQERPLDPRRGHGDGHQQVLQTKDADPEEEAEVPTELEALTPHHVDYDRLHVFNCTVLMNYLVCAPRTCSTQGPHSKPYM